MKRDSFFNDTFSKIYVFNPVFMRYYLIYKIKETVVQNKALASRGKK